jgi:hypothetical protein
MNTYDFPATFDRARYEALCAAGMPAGLGTRESDSVMAALNLACGGDLTDSADSPCVLPAAARFAIRLNDSRWTSPSARAAGMHDLGLALLGTADLDRNAFVTRLAEGIIRRVLPIALRAAKLDAAADRCEREGTMGSASAAATAAYTYASSASAAASAAYAASASAAASAAYAAASAAASAAYAAASAAASAAYAYAAASAGDAYAAAADAAAAAYAYAAASAASAAADIPLLAAARLATEILTEMRGAL